MSLCQAPEVRGHHNKMTERQKKYLDLFNQGHSIKEIAELTGRAPSTVHSALQQARQSSGTKGRCRYSDSCFTCPQKDCTVNGLNINPLSEEVF